MYISIWSRSYTAITNCTSVSLVGEDQVKEDLGEMRGPVFDYIVPVHVEGLWLSVYGPIQETVHVQQTTDPFSSTFHSAYLSLDYIKGLRTMFYTQCTHCRGSQFVALNFMYISAAYLYIEQAKLPRQTLLCNLPKIMAAFCEKVRGTLLRYPYTLKLIKMADQNQNNHSWREIQQLIM